MLPTRTDLFGLMSGRSSWLGERLAVLGRNIANADTPEFRPLDLRPAEPDELLARSNAAPRGIELARTAPAHVAGLLVAAAGDTSRRVKGFEVAPSGNEIVLPEQMAKLADTELDYQLTTNLYRRYLGMMRTALGVSQG